MEKKDVKNEIKKVDVAKQEVKGENEIKKADAVKEEVKVKSEIKKADTVKKEVKAEKKSKSAKATDKNAKTKVETSENGDINTENKDEKSSKKKKIITYSVAGGLVLLIVILAIALILNLNKISKGDAEKLVKSYITAVNDKDGEKYLGLVDTKGYIIFKEEGEKKFKEKYKDKDKYIKKYMSSNDYDDFEDVEYDVEKNFKSLYRYSSNEYSFKEIKEIKKSEKSSNIVVVKAKIKVKSKYSTATDNKTLVLYTVKVNGKYKIIGEEIR